MSTKIRVLIADDHPLFRKGLRQVIESDPGLEIVAEAENGAAALEQISLANPDVAVMDVHMPGIIPQIELATGENCVAPPKVKR